MPELKGESVKTLLHLPKISLVVTMSHMCENDNKSLVDFGAWSKPATVLIERISGAMGAVCESHRIWRIAKAEAETARTKAFTDVAVAGGQERALRRLIAEEGRQQENIEKITADAASQLADNAKPEEMEPDWIANFIEKARLVSNTELQILWARILAGEATNPGSHSKRTIELVASLDRADGQLFTNLCSFAVMFNEPLPLVYDATAAVYNGRGVNFASLRHLESIGLINYSQRAGFVMQGLRGNLGLTYFGGVFRLRPKRPLQDFKLGDVTFTKSGKQLFAVYDSKPNPYFPLYLSDKFKSFGYEVLAAPKFVIAAPK
jgi:hypothetical protein